MCPMFLCVSKKCVDFSNFKVKTWQVSEKTAHTLTSN